MQQLRPGHFLLLSLPGLVLAGTACAGDGLGRSPDWRIIEWANVKYAFLVMH
jgi:hypothetical protein